MTTRERARRLRSPSVAIGVGSAALLALLTLVPVVPWQARCYEVPVAGPYRPIFIEQVTAWLSRQDVYYWEINDVIFLRILPLFDGNQSFNRAGILQNISKISDRLEDDITIDGVLYPKPPAVKQLEQRPLGTYDGIDLCTAAIRPSPTDPPLP